MSVLITTPAFDKPSGVSAYYSTLRDHLHPEVRFCVTGARSDNEAFITRCARLLRDYGRFYRMARSSHCDLVHLNPSLGPKALIRDGLSLLVARALGKRVLVFVRGWDPACESSIRRRFLWLFRLVYFKADAFVVLASQFESVLREFGYTKPIYLETTAVADDVFSRAQVKPARPEWDSTGVKILFLSRIEKSKGIYEAIDAFRLLREKYPSATLAVAGVGMELENARHYVRTKGIDGVRFLGWITGEQKHKALSDADIYLFPTHWGEGMPNSVLEAMAYGLPVITRPLGGLADFFEEGQMGFTTDSSDPQVFASLVERLIGDPDLRRRMAQYNRSFARRNFAASVVARKLMEIHRRTLHGESCVVRSTSSQNAPGGGPLSVHPGRPEDV